MDEIRFDFQKVTDDISNQISKSSRSTVIVDYVYHLKKSSDALNLFASFSDNSVKMYDINNFRLLQTVREHTKTINCLESSKKISSIVYTGSDDGNIFICDFRCKKKQAKVYVGNEILSISIDSTESLVAASFETTIAFYDLRKMSSEHNNTNKLCEYADVHSDWITQLQFHPVKPSILCAGSEDGLVSIYDISTAATENAVVSILNTDSPIRKFGFYGVDYEGIYCLSTIETASFFHYPSSQRIASFSNIKETLEVDYLVDCFYVKKSDQICLLTGKYNGDIVLAEVTPKECKTISKFETGKHTEIIRCMEILKEENLFETSYDNNNNYNNNSTTIFTGGEDSKICCWKKNSDLDNNNSINNSIKNSKKNYIFDEKMNLTSNIQNKVDDATENKNYIINNEIDDHKNNENNNNSYSNDKMNKKTKKKSVKIDTIDNNKNNNNKQNKNNIEIISKALKLGTDMSQEIEQLNKKSKFENDNDSNKKNIII
jgi:WD40 repeat protein